MSSSRILQDDDWVVGAPSEKKSSHKPVSSPTPPPSSSFSSARLTRAPQKLNGNSSSSSNHNNSNSHAYIKGTCNTTSGNSSTNIMNNVIRSYPSSRDTRHEAYGFFSTGQNTHHFESYLSRKGHQDIQPFPQARSSTERVSVPLPEGTGKAAGVWNAFNGSYTQQDWANYARGQAAPGAKRPTNIASTTAATATATARTNGPTSTAVASHQAQKPSLSPLAKPSSAHASASSAARPSSSSSSSSSSTSKPSAAPMAPPRPPALLIDLEFTSNTPVTPTLNSSVLADLMDLDFSPITPATTTTTAPIIGADIGTEPPKDSAEKAAVTAESTLIDFSDAFSGPPALNESRCHSASSVSFGDAIHSDDHMAAGGYTTGNTDYDDEDSDSGSDSGSDSDSDSSDDDDDDHLHRQFGVDKSLHNDKDAESDAKGIFVDFATLANLRTELLDANVTWEDLLTRLKRGHA
ncbi:hypothetical protein KI688_000406 [Linnemannia hyalina]|uniref:Uncharacterized protein n=1 Tax=Linnemannia hyalina TaxID=64524 RepID=A0A9P7Y462_9FUNG|nr:hypothetical protein KI688_000406 [Linnemannia hyalina]